MELINGMGILLISSVFKKIFFAIGEVIYRHLEFSLSLDTLTSSNNNANYISMLKSIY